MEYKIIYSLENEFNKNEPIFTDIETEGLYTDIRMIQLFFPKL